MGTAKAAAAAGVPYVFSTVATSSMQVGQWVVCQAIMLVVVPSVVGLFCKFAWWHTSMSSTKTLSDFRQESCRAKEGFVVQVLRWLKQKFHHDHAGNRTNRP
eukprot:1158213-Pelagomonas_calceolata.AAC.2